MELVKAFSGVNEGQIVTSNSTLIEGSMEIVLSEVSLISIKTALCCSGLRNAFSRNPFVYFNSN